MRCILQYRSLTCAWNHNYQNHLSAPYDGTPLQPVQVGTTELGIRIGFTKNRQNVWDTKAGEVKMQNVYL